MTSRTMTTIVTVPAGSSPYHPIEQRTTTTTVTESNVRGRRLRLFVSGLLQLAFGGLSLIPVLLLGSNPLTIACCACLAFTGMAGILGSCFSDGKPTSSVFYDANSGGQRVVTVRPIFPRFYCFMVVVGFCLGVASAIQGIIMISDDDRWHSYIRGSVAVGIGIFLALNQMLMICCVFPLIRTTTSSSEHVTIQPVQGVVGLPVSSAYQGTHLSAGGSVPGSVLGSVPGPNSPMYPYIDEPVKEDPPSYMEATRHDPQARPSAPPEKV